MVVPAGRAAAAAVCCAALSVSLSCRDSSPAPASPESIGESEVWSEVERLYELAKRKGEEVPKDVYEWVAEDVKRYGDWEYRVVDLSPDDAAALETRLNEMGAERWECIWIEARPQATRLFLKRPAKNYLRTLPLSDLLKLVPAGDGEAG